jgi:hypothetical protein
MDYLTKHLAEPECKQYTAWEIFKYNYFIWVACFFIGLQFTHLDNGIFQEFTLDWNVMKNWPLILWVLFVGLVLLVGTLVLYIMYLYDSIGYLDAYINTIGWLVGIFTSMVYWYCNWLGYNLHIHHWFIGAVLQGVMCW